MQILKLHVCCSSAYSCMCKSVHSLVHQPGTGVRGYQSIPPAEDDSLEVGGAGACSTILAIVSFTFVVMFFPFSLLVSIKVSDMILYQ